MTEGEHRGPTSEGEWRGPRDTGLTAVGISAARARVLDRLRSRHEAWGVPELADVLQLHRNTVREHLSSLVDAGLAEFTEIRSERHGRPARHYRATRRWSTTRTAPWCVTSWPARMRTRASAQAQPR